MLVVTMRGIVGVAKIMYLALARKLPSSPRPRLRAWGASSEQSAQHEERQGPQATRPKGQRPWRVELPRQVHLGEDDVPRPDPLHRPVVRGRGEKLFEVRGHCLSDCRRLLQHVPMHSLSARRRRQRAPVVPEPLPQHLPELVKVHGLGDAKTAVALGVMLGQFLAETEAAHEVQLMLMVHARRLQALVLEENSHHREVRDALGAHFLMDDLELPRCELAIDLVLRGEMEVELFYFVFTVGKGYVS